MAAIDLIAEAVPTGSKSTSDKRDQLCVNTIRTLAMDVVQAANSGHPGTPMALAPVVYCLWQRILRFDPSHPIWPNRDRFVLSVGHASMLLYAMLHLAGVRAVNPKYETLGEFSVTLEDIKRFRQLDSKCPGHPECRWTSGVETTTGPLGQGLATSVGMAIAQRWLASYFNRPGFDLLDYDIYALCGDGCMMEGISGEAASLAGHLRLDNLCWIYGNNHITIEGNTALAYSDDVATRFIGFGWNVTRVGDANDLEMVERALRTFKRTNDRPTLIIVDSHIAYGAPHKQDTSAAHGEPLGEEEIRLAKRNYGWPADAKFLVPDEVREHFQKGIGARGSALHQAWWAGFEEYRRQFPELAEQGYRMLRRELPDGWDDGWPTFPANPKGVATRDASGQALNVFAKHVPWLIGGSADLAPSCKTRLTFDGAGDFSAEQPAGRNLHFGIREHAMGAILNGLSLSKLRPFGSGFLIFSDYGRAAIRLSALMEIPVLHIFTHDSIGVGEDGPTHQPVEHLASLRAIPGLITLRPADANEVVEAWRVIAQFRHEPVALILTRQAVPTLDRTKYAAAEGVRPKFLDRTEQMVCACMPSVPVAENPGVVLGTILGVAAQEFGRDKMTIVTSPGIFDFGAWLEQLVAESTGKDGKGLIPINREALGQPDVYGRDRLFVYLRLSTAPDVEQDASVDQLERAGHPVVRIAVDDPYDLGEEFFRWEFATAVAGSILRIHPFDQPDVEASKVATRKLTEEYEKTGALPQETPIFMSNGIKLFTDDKNAAALAMQISSAPTLAGYFKGHLSRLNEGDYCALLAYIEMKDTHERVLQEIRQRIRDVTRVATCLEFGPRFLHSTGQAYKGGPKTGLFLQITCDDAIDLPVPGGSTPLV